MAELTYGLDGSVVGGNSSSAPPLSPPTQNSPPTQSYTPEQIQARINVLAPHFGVDPNFATAVAKQESSFNPHATSPKGAQGVFQLMPETAKSYGVNNAYDPDQNIAGGLKYLSDLQKKHNGDKYKTLVEYNSGPGNVNKKFEDLPDETQGYLTKILGSNTATTHGSNEQTYDLNGNPLDLSKSPIVQQRSPGLTPEQQKARTNLGDTYSGPGQTIREAAQYAPLALGAAGGYVGGLAGVPNLGAGVGSGLGEILAGSAKHGVPTEEDLKNALAGGVSAFGIGSLFSLPGALRNQVTKSILDKTNKSANILEGARQELTGGISSGAVANKNDQLAAKLAPVKKAESAQWEKVNSRMDKASHIFDAVTGQDPATGQPITTPTPIRGPVKLSKDSLDYINETKNQLKDIVEKFPSSKLLNAYNSLDRVSKALVTDKTGDSYLPFDAAKQLRTDIGAATASESKINLQAPNKSIGLQRGGGVLASLRDKLGSDIESTLTNMGPDALKEYGDAVGMTKTRIKASLFDKVISKNTSEGTGMLNVDKAINDFKNPTSPFAKEFTSEERNSITGALNSIRNVSPQYDGALKYGSQGPGKFIFYSAYAAAHPMKFIVAIASKDLFEKILSQPKYAKILAQLPSAPSKSSQASMMTKSLLKGALKSVPAEMIAPSGFKVKGHIDDQGNPTPDFQLSQSQ